MLPDLPGWLVLIIVAVAGAFVGRFLNVCIQCFPQHDRLADQLKAVLRSQTVCRKCVVQPSLTERLPIIGWFLTGRRCHACRSLLPAELPLVETVTALLFAVLYWFEIPGQVDGVVSYGGLRSSEGPRGPEVITTLWAPMTWLHLRCGLHLLMISGLIVATWIDRRLRIIPDGSTVPVLLLAVLAAGTFGQLYIVPIWFQDPSTVKILKPMMPELLQPLFVPWDPTAFIQQSPHLHGILVSVCGAAAGAGAIWIVRQIGFLILKQEAMGFGDVVLMAMIGSVIGWQPVLAVFVLAPMLAITAAIVNWIAHRDNEIPYGPFLSAATVLLLLTWPWLWPFAKRFFDMGPFLILMAFFMVVLLAASLQLVQIIKRMLGFGHSDFMPEDGGWTSADHLSYYGSERPDEQTGQWPREQWPGSRAGRGLRYWHDWKQ